MMCVVRGGVYRGGILVVDVIYCRHCVSIIRERVIYLFLNCARGATSEAEIIY